MPTSSLRDRPLLLLLIPVLAFGLAFFAWNARQSQLRNGPLYCITQPGRVWGLARVPAGAVPGCPQSQSYRREVREGFSRVEQYTLKGWQPRALLPVFEKAGFVAHPTVEDSGESFAVFLDRGAERLQYAADLQPNGKTLIGLSGKPR